MSHPEPPITPTEYLLGIALVVALVALVAEALRGWLP